MHIIIRKRIIYYRLIKKKKTNDKYQYLKNQLSTQVRLTYSNTWFGIKFVCIF